MNNSPETNQSRVLDAAEMRTVGGGATDFLRSLRIDGVNGECRMEVRLQDVLITSYSISGAG